MGHITRFAIVGHVKDGDGEWHHRVGGRLFDTYDDAREDARHMFGEFDREINDAFAYPVEVQCYA